MLLSRFWLGAGLALLAARAAHGQAPPAADSIRPGPHFTYTEQLPVFPPQEPADTARSTTQRVIQFLNKGLHFPAKALRDGVQGKVYFKFVVDAQGHVNNIRLAQGLRDDVDAEVLRNAHRLDAIRWQPGTQNGRPVAVSFTVPITFSVSGGSPRPGVPGTDSLDLPRFTKFKLPSGGWNLAKAPPAGQAVLYGTCLQRLGWSSGGVGQYVRVVNLSTGQAFRLNVKPALRSRRENGFCYVLPPGRYALSQYEFNHSQLLLDYRAERLLRPQPQRRPSVGATRYEFTLLPGQLHYVGTWNFANEGEPLFLNEKALLDPDLQAEYPGAALAGARLAIPE